MTRPDTADRREPLLVSASGSRLPRGLVHLAVSGGADLLHVRRPRPPCRRGSRACGPPAWKAIMKACPEVCMHRLANSIVRSAIRRRISRRPSRAASAPASRHAFWPALYAGSSSVEVRVRVLHAQPTPYGRSTSPPTQSSVPGWPRSRGGAEQGVEGGLARRHVQAAVLPGRPWGARGGGPVRARADRVPGARSRVGRCWAISWCAVSSAAMRGPTLSLTNSPSTSASTLRRVRGTWGKPGQKQADTARVTERSAGDKGDRRICGKPRAGGSRT